MMVYPRAYGGTEERAGRKPVCMGLSPRIRGNPRDSAIKTLPEGSIPAHTGEPGFRVGHRSLPGVYPRAYGGTALSTTGERHVKGLSPRIRGNHIKKKRVLARVGSIPAHTGEPRPPPAPRRRTGVYPRAYGGTVGHPRRQAAQEGLSPRIRGNRVFRLRRRGAERSIPAHTGEPRRPASTASTRRVYPRAYGGTALFRPALLLGEGLSPRIRGNRRGALPGHERGGSIPAHTGEPGAGAASPSRGRVYPRAYGGT